MRTLYISDLDGTLLNRQGRISENSHGILNELIERGMDFTYATARSFSSAMNVTQGLTVHIPIIAYNGGFIVNAGTGEIVTSTIFREEEKQFIIKLLAEHHVYPLVYAFIDGIERVSWITSRENEGIKHYLNKRIGDKRFQPLSSEQNLYIGDVIQFTCIGEREELLPIYEALRDNQTYSCIFQQELYEEEYWCEIMLKTATKANAVGRLRDMLGFDRIVSFGDALNDIPMFRISDECYAVDNAVPELKQIATAVIGSNEQDGVARWLAEHVHPIEL